MEESDPLLLKTQLLYRQTPRSFALRGRPNSYAEPSKGLYFVTEHLVKTNQATIRLQPLDTANFDDYNRFFSKSIYGILGLFEYAGDSFLVIVTKVENVGQIGNDSVVYRISDVQFISLTSDKYDALATGFDSINDVSYYSTDTGPSPPTEVYHPCDAFKKLFQYGTFYFSPAIDLTRPLAQSLVNYAADIPLATVVDELATSAQVNAPRSSPRVNIDMIDPMFWWNQFLLKDLLLMRSRELSVDERDWLDGSGLFVAAVQGYFGLKSVRISSAAEAGAVLFSRVGCKRAGTRFLSRGVDDDGNVANFVETEFCVTTDSTCQSFVQVRGTVPVFWEQTGLQWSHKIEFSRSPEATFVAVEKHFAMLLQRHPPAVHIVNLLGQKPNSSELALAVNYKQHFSKWVVEQNAACRDEGLPPLQCKWVDFDLNEKCRGTDYSALAQLYSDVKPLLDQMGATTVDLASRKLVTEQQGVIRTNCVDCLDRTNVAQKLFADIVSETFFAQLGLRVSLRDYATDSGPGSKSALVASRLNTLWAENGDALSRIYAGTGALKSGFTRSGKQTVLGLLGDAAKTANRFMISNFQDKGRQEAIQALLGYSFTGNTVLAPNPVHGMVAQALRSRASSYASFSESRVYVVTFNVNGKLPDSELDVLPLLEPALSSGVPPSIVVVALQEIVEMSASSFATGGSDKLLELWTLAIDSALKMLRSRSKHVGKYTLVKTSLLVGIGLALFVDTAALPMLSRVERCIVKTGFGGIAGNKGAVAVVFRLQDTSICAISSHLAAGDRVEDRIRDAAAIRSGIRFAQNGTLEDVDVVIWSGDLNFRVDMANEQVRQLVNTNMLRRILESDQLLRLLRQKQSVFSGFHEGPLTFFPTYKYDVNADTYDSRPDKARTPSWTDRVLFKFNSGSAASSASNSHIEQTLVSYGRSEIRISDHRPVYALFKIAVCHINKKTYQQLEKQFYTLFSKQQQSASVPEKPPPLPYRPPVTGQLIDVGTSALAPKPLGPVPKEKSLLDEADEWGEFTAASSNPSLLDKSKETLDNPFAV